MKPFRDGSNAWDLNGGTGGRRPVAGRLLLSVAGVVLLPWSVGRIMPGSIDTVLTWAVASAGLVVFIVLIRHLMTGEPRGTWRIILGGFRRPALWGECRGATSNGARFPTITAGLMMVGTITFFIFPASVIHPSACLALDDLGVWNLALVTVAGVLRHADAGHLAFNMVLLGIFGILLEPRLGRGPILATVVLGSVLSSLISLNLLLSREAFLDAAVQFVRHPPVGTSGAVAGLMGLSILPNRRWRWPTPSASGLSDGLLRPATMALPVLIGLFLLRDFSGSAVTVAGLAGSVDYWAHLGALLGGLIVAAVAGLEDPDSGGLPGAHPLSSGKFTRRCGLDNHRRRANPLLNRRRTTLQHETGGAL